MSLKWLALLEPFILSQPIGHDKVPMFFWGPLSGPGGVRKIRRLLGYATSDSIFFLNDLDPDGCLVADQLRACTKTLESTGADKQKSLIPNWRLPCKKKTSFFAMEKCFLLTGAF
jgi:hypothetical protein